MYSSFFGFSEKPFEVTPDPRFLYLSPSHRETLASLEYGIRERRGFIAVIGEVGTGKTTLINAVLDRIEGGTKTAYISNTALTFNQLLLSTLLELGLHEPGNPLSKVGAIRLLNDFAIRQLSEGGNVVLFIDEAQNLDIVSMENLRLLSNLETRKHKLIQIVLSGQPELDAKLKQPELRQLAQRISVRRWINTLTEEESYAYVQHRVDASDYKGPSLFGRKALEMIYEYSGGIPRKINILCDNALLIGYALKKRRIDADCVAEAAGDLNWAPIPKASDHAPATALAPVPQFARKGLRFRIALAGGMALAVGLVVAAWTNFGKSGSTFSLRNPPLSESIVQAKVNPVQDTESQPVPQPLSVPEAKSVLAHQAGPASMANERGVAESVMDTKEGRNREKLLMQSSELEKENLAFPTETPSEQKLPLPMKSAVAENPAHFSLKTVIVQRDDVLSTIILRAYGRYDAGLLNKVLKENPGIPTPDYIFVGQVIRLPALEPKQLNQFD